MKERIKAIVMDSTYRQLLQTVGLLVALLGISAACFFGVRFVMAVEPFSVTLTSPTSGSVSGVIDIAASTEIPVASVEFEVQDMSGNTMWSATGINSDTTYKNWVASWDSSGVSDGYYQVKARGTADDSTTYGSGPTTITVSNGSSSTSNSSEVTYPMSGSSVSGVVDLSAVTGSAAEYVDFIITDSSSEMVAQVDGFSDDGTGWSGSWDTSGTPNGYYYITAEAGFGVNIIASDAVGFYVQNSTISLEITSPDYNTTLTSVVTLQAVASEAISDLKFVITDLSGAIVEQMFATDVDGTGVTWEADWNASLEGIGSYYITAKHGTHESGDVLVHVEISGSSSSGPTNIDMVSPAARSYVSGVVELVAETDSSGGSAYFEMCSTSTCSDLWNVTASVGSDGVNWTGSWDSSNYADGTYYVKPILDITTAQIAGTQISIILDNDSDSSGSTSTETSTTVGILSPVSGSTVSGSVALSAQTSVSVSLVSFEVWPEGSTSPPETINGGVGSDTTIWNASYDSSNITEGWYRVKATAQYDGATYISSAIRFYIDNSTDDDTTTDDSTDTTVTDISVEVIEPSNSSEVSGTVSLVATTSNTVEALDFTVSPVNDSGVNALSFTGTSINSTDTRWSASWTVGSDDTGDFQIIATAWSQGVSFASSPVVVSIETVDTTITDLTVDLRPPSPDGSDIVGPIELKATSTPHSDTSSLRFVVTGLTTGTRSGSLTATFNNLRSAWLSDWNPSSFGVGGYSIYAEATSSDGNTYISDYAEVTVAESTTDDTTTQEQIEINITSPTSGSRLAETVQLVSAVAGSPQEVNFKVYPVNVTDSNASLTVPASKNSTGNWVASWNSERVPNGDYAITATASDGSISVDSSEVTVTVSNVLSADTTQEYDGLQSIKVMEPLSGSYVSGLVEIAASTVGPADSVTFRVENISLGLRSGINAEPVSGTNRWRAVWGTAGLPMGRYSLVAVGVSGDQTLVSERVFVILASEDGVDDISTQTETETVTDQEADTTTEEIKPIVDIIRPAPGPVRGIVSLAASSAGKITAVKFIIKKSGAVASVLSRLAVYDRSRLMWTSFWNSSGMEPGKYIVVAEGLDDSGNKVRSVPVEVSVPQPLETTETAEVDRQITRIATEAVVEAIKEIPEGTTADESELPEQSEESVSQLDAECKAAGIPIEKCHGWLAAKYRAEECRRAGIITKEECVAHLWEMYGGSIPECAGRSRDYCTEYLFRKTSGFLGSKELDDIEKDIIPKIGSIVRFSRVQPPVSDTADVEGEVPADATAETLAKTVPLKGDKEVRVRLHASPAYTKVSDTKSRRSMPAIVIVDTDEDGLPDDAEKRLGTDPENPDSDGDGYMDADEIRNGYNPLGSGRLGDAGAPSDVAPIDAAMLSGVPIEQPRFTGDISEDLIVDEVVSGDEETDTEEDGADAASDTLRFTGKALPGEVVTLFVYSYLPMVLTTTADESGNWEYDLDSGLVDGEHEVYVTVTDNTGKIKSRSNPVAFFVAEASAVTPEEFFGQPVEKASVILTPHDEISRVSNWYIFGAIGLVVLALSIGIVIVLRPKKPKFEDM
jgi:hypothetical protein